MRQDQTEISVKTAGQALTDITSSVRTFLDESGIETGILTVFCRHTSASLIIQENADPDVQRDLVVFFRRLVPDGDPLFVHTAEGPDDMPAHVKTALTQTSLSIPVTGGSLALGTWQGIYLFEHRRRAHDRQILLHICGQ